MTVVAIVVLAGFGAPASAHPLGNFTINHLVKIHQAGDSLRVRYILDMAEIPTFALMRSRNASGVLDADGLRAWASSEVEVVTTDLEVRADGAQLHLQSIGAPAVRTRPGAGGLLTLYWVGDFLARPGDARTLEIADSTYPGRIGWKDVVIAPSTEPTAELTHYPTALLASPRNVSEAWMTRSRDGAWVASDATTAPPATASASASQLRSNALADMLARGPSSILAVILTLLAAIGLGALHALEPGHGKTLLAVSLVGARATPKQALLLAAGLTLAHTAGVMILGFALLAAAQWIVPEAIYPWITAASGLTVIWLGANALARFVRSRRGGDHEHAIRPTNSVGGQASLAPVGPTSHVGGQASLAPVGPTSHVGGQASLAPVGPTNFVGGQASLAPVGPMFIIDRPTIKVGTTEVNVARPTIKVGPTEVNVARPTIKVGPTEVGATHGHSHEIPGSAPLSFRSVMLVAMGGNIAPCPAALVVMLTALTLHQLGYGLVIIIAFGIGLAAVLTGLGIAIVRGAALLARSQMIDRALAYGPLISAAVISGLGATMFAQGLASGIIRAPGWLVILLTLTAIAGFATRPGHVHAHEHAH